VSVRVRVSQSESVSHCLKLSHWDLSSGSTGSFPALAMAEAVAAGGMPLVLVAEAVMSVKVVSRMPLADGSLVSVAQARAAIATDMAAAAAELAAEAQVAVLTLIDEYPPKLPPPPNPMQQARCSICDLRPCRTACRTCQRGACFHDNCYDIPKRSCVPCLSGGNPQEVRGKWVVGPLDSSSAGRSVAFQHLGG
jgi:hypothetical protein